MKHFLLFCGVLFATISLWGQPTHYSLSLTGGRVIPVNGSKYSGNSPTFGADFSIYWQQRDSADWVRFWQQPYFGVRGNYAHIVNSIAGDRFELAGFIQAPVYRNLHWVYSVGLSGYTQPYSLTHDPDNEFIGSTLNCLIDLGFLYNVRLRNDDAFFLAAKLVHSSNGYLYKPNHGLNYIQAELGYRFAPHATAQVNSGQPTVHRPQFMSDFVPRSAFFVSMAPGFVMSRNDDIDLIRYYPTYTFELGWIRHPHCAFSYGTALDLSYNGSHRLLAPSDEWPVYPALTAFGDCHWGAITLRLGLAHYLAYYPQNWEQYYERVGLFYHFGAHKRHHAGVAMKVHYDHVDYIEWTYGIEF